MATNKLSNQLFKDFVKEQKELNEFEEKEFKAKTSNILRNPEEFAKEYIETNIALNIGRIFKAYRLGVDFAKKNIQNQ